MEDPDGAKKSLQKELTLSNNKEENLILKLSHLKELLLRPASLDEKLKLITDKIVSIFGADFARIWLIKKADLCDNGCLHADVTEGPHLCTNRKSCLHLVVSSGRYTHTDGYHQRVPMGSYKIGRIASGKDFKFVTNDVCNDPRVHDHEWARKLGLVSFSGFKLTSDDGKPIGVLALFSKQPMEHYFELILEDLANTTSQVILAGNIEKSLRKSEEKYYNLFENAQVAMYRATGDGSLLLDVNQKFADLFGYSKEDMLKNPETIRFLDLELRDKMKKELKEKGVITNFEIPIIAKNGEVKTVLASMKLYPEDWYLEGTAIDITKRRRMEKKLIESENKYKTLAESSTDSIYVFDKNLNYNYLNHQALTMVDKKPDEIIGKGIEEVFPPDVSERMKKSVLNVFKSGESFSIEGKYILPVGVQWLNTSLIPIKDSDGNINFVLGISRDVTEYKLFENELKEREEHLRFLTDNMIDVIAQVNAEGILTYASPSLKLLSGFEPIEVIGKGTPDIVHPDDQKMVINLMNKAIKAKKPVTLQYRSLKSDGSFVWAESTAKPVYDALGNFKSLVFSTRDISQRKKAELALIESEKTLNALINAITEPEFMLDIDGKILFANDSLAKRFNRKREELIGANAYELIPGDLGRERNEKISKVFESGESMVFADVRNGVYFDNHIYPIKDDDGRVSRVAVFSIDVTHRKIAEEQIKLQNRILEGINTILERSIQAETEDELAKNALEVCEGITESKFGFILELNENGKLDALAISDPGWDECVMEDAVIMLKDMEQHGVHGKASKDDVPVLTNDPSNHEDSVGTPPGHPAINSFLGTPLKQGNRVIGSIGVANKVSGYNLEDQTVLEKLSGAISESLMRKRAENSLKAALGEKELLLREIHHRVKNNLMVISSLLNLQSRYLKDKEAIGVFKESQNRARSMALIHERLYRSTDMKNINFGDYISNIAHDL